MGSGCGGDRAASPRPAALLPFVALLVLLVPGELWVRLAGAGGGAVVGLIYGGGVRHANPATAEQVIMRGCRSTAG